MRLVSFLRLPTAPWSARRVRSIAVLPALITAAALACGVLAPRAPALAAEPVAPTDPAMPRAGGRSLDFYFAALAAAPDDLSAARARGRIEARWDEAGSATADLLAARAATALAAGDRALALDLLDAAVVVAPDWVNARFRRATVHLAGHDIGRATADLLDTVAREPRHIGALTALAAIDETSGRKAAALKWLRRLAALDPRNPAVAAERLDRLRIDVEGREL